MPASSRPAVIKVHMLLAAFVFPAALMFLVTGGFYTWGIKGNYVNTVHNIPLTEPLQADSAVLADLARQELDRLSITFPTGKPKLKKSGTSFLLEWTGSERDVVLEPTLDPRSARLTVKETTWYRKLVQLHKAKGGQLFKVYAAVLAVSLFVILATGFILALQIPRYRTSAIVAAVAGSVVFVLVAGLS